MAANGAIMRTSILGVLNFNGELITVPYLVIIYLLLFSFPQNLQIDARYSQGGGKHNRDIESDSC